jgi:opacity protein-like surface antigen
MKKLLTIATLAFLLMSVSTVEAQDVDIELAPRIGYDLGDLNEFFIGAEGRFYIEDLPVVLSPGFDYYFASSDFEGVSLNLFGIDLNALYEFELEDSNITPYAGGGIGILRQSVSVDGVDGGFGVSGVTGSTTETGINLLGGAIFNIDAPVRPFVQAKTNLGSNFTLFSLMGGVLIDL